VRRVEEQPLTQKPLAAWTRYIGTETRARITRRNLSRWRNRPSNRPVEQPTLEAGRTGATIHRQPQNPPSAPAQASTGKRVGQRLRFLITQLHHVTESTPRLTGVNFFYHEGRRPSFWRATMSNKTHAEQLVAQFKAQPKPEQTLAHHSRVH